MNDGGPAFPKTQEFDSSGNCMPDGMTLRDYFAAKAMEAIIGTAAGPCFFENQLDPVDVVAGTAYKMADAMLKQREKKS